jgi:hypothetical protein
MEVITVNTHGKLIDVCRLLSITMLEVAKFVQLSDKVDVACWGYDLRKKENFIYLNPRMLKLPAEMVALILKHEILHYAGYKGLHFFKDRELENIVLDVCINKILFLAEREKMAMLCRRIYPKETINTALVLARADISNDKRIKDDNLRELWKEIWQNDEVPNPTSLYFRLIQYEREITGMRIGFSGKRAGDCKNNPFRGEDNSDILFREEPDDKGDKFTELEKEILEDIGMKIPYPQREAFSDQVSSLFSQHFVKKKAFSIAEVSDFIKRLQIMQQLDDTSNKINSALNGKIRRDLYPYNLSRLSIIYAACGINNFLPVYFNKIPEGRKPNIAIYVDTSPSMDDYKEYEIYLVESLQEDFPTKIFLFAGDVMEISTNEFAEGNYESGYSTSFDAVIEHLINIDYECGLIFTDGYSSINGENKEKFNKCGKRLFTVYFNYDSTSDLDKLSEQVMNIQVA